MNDDFIFPLMVLIFVSGILVFVGLLVYDDTHTVTIHTLNSNYSIPENIANKRCEEWIAAYAGEQK